ncbi:hypothetical protein BBAG_1085 [Bifidobacterium angulatum DSM 20098 = JCM 7096]|nr:hypothetical protein BBAG_1085 [Bifidobacterium angulatum DSM 20098 = JCM 7096]
MAEQVVGETDPAYAPSRRAAFGLARAKPRQSDLEAMLRLNGFIKVTCHRTLLTFRIHDLPPYDILVRRRSGRSHGDETRPGGLNKRLG